MSDQSLLAALNAANPQVRENPQSRMGEAALAPTVINASADQISQAQAQGRDAERARMSAILGHAEAKGRETLAQHLAFNTSLSTEDAGAILAASPAAAPPAPAQQQPAQVVHQSPLDRVMSQIQQPPNPGAGADAGPVQKEEPRMTQTAEQIFARRRADVQLSLRGEAPALTQRPR